MKIAISTYKGFASTLLTGQCDPNAQEGLRASNIKVKTACLGKVLDALSKYKKGIE